MGRVLDGRRQEGHSRPAAIAATQSGGAGGRRRNRRAGSWRVAVGGGRTSPILWQSTSAIHWPNAWNKAELTSRKASTTPHPLFSSCLFCQSLRTLPCPSASCTEPPKHCGSP